MPGPIVPVHITAPPIASPSVAPSSKGAFDAVFNAAISKVEDLQQNAQTSVDRFLSGEDEELHQVAVAAQQAEVSFQLFMQVRNKVVAAYQQVMQMQV